MLKASIRIWRWIQTGVLSGIAMAGRVASRVSLTLPGLLALAVPAVLEAQITVSPQFVQGSTPGRWIFTGTYNVPASCGGDTFTFLQGRDPSGKPIGTTSFVSATPAAATAVTPGTSGGFLLEFKTGIPDQEKVVADFDIPAGTTQASSLLFRETDGTITCSRSWPTRPISVPTSGARARVVSTARGGPNGRSGWASVRAPRASRPGWDCRPTIRRGSTTLLAAMYCSTEW